MKSFKSFLHGCIEINDNTSDQAEAKEARQNIAKHVQTELVSETHSSEVIILSRSFTEINSKSNITFRVIAKI